jgi:CHAD domain-containing protein
MRWRVKGVKAVTPFSPAAGIILRSRLKTLLKLIREYFIEDSAEKLHEIRIALRRLRYTLEIFYCCFDKKIFTPFYEEIEKLQDLSGEIRDLDVLEQNAIISSGAKSKALTLLLKNINEKRSNIKGSLRLELMKFIHSKEIKEFRNQLNKRR